MKQLNTIELNALKTVTGGAWSGSWANNNWAAKSDWAAPAAAKTTTPSWNTGSWNWASGSR